MTTAWIFVPPRSSPPFIRVTAAIARPPRSACGSPVRSTPATVCRLASRGRSGRPNESTIVGVSVVVGVKRAPGALDVGDAVRARREPFGPGREQHALRCAARVEHHRPLAGHENRDHEPGLEHVLGHVDRVARAPRSGHVPSAPRRSTAGRSATSRTACPRRARAPNELWRQRLRQGATLVATAGDREQRVHRPSLPAEKV